MVVVVVVIAVIVLVVVAVVVLVQKTGVDSDAAYGELSNSSVYRCRRNDGSICFGMGWFGVPTGSPGNRSGRN